MPTPMLSTRLRCRAGRTTAAKRHTRMPCFRSLGFTPLDFRALAARMESRSGPVPRGR